MAYFQSAQPLVKGSLLKVFEDVAEITQLFVAPFGVPRDTIDILGEFVASNDIKSIYRNWEDSLSRKLYVLSGISDDRVAASIQLYIEEKRDSEVMKTLRMNDAAPSGMLNPSAVVELGIGSGDSDAAMALAALRSVVKAVKAINEDLANALCSESGSAARAYPLSVLNPSDVLFIASAISMDTLAYVSNCLKNIKLSDAPDSKRVSLSYEQYVALLDSCVDDPAIYPYLRILTGHTPSTDITSIQCENDTNEADSAVTKSEARKCLHELRCLGIRHRDVQFGSFFCHPMQTSLFEMEAQLDTLCPSSTYGNENSLNEEQAECQAGFLSSLELLHSYNHIREIRQTPKRPGMGGHPLFGGAPEDDDDEASEGDVLQALCCVDDAMAQLERIVKGSVEEYEDDGSVGPPVKLRSELLIERAVCRSKLQAFDEALQDINAALKLEPKSATAYKCRFKIYQHLAQQAMGRDELDGNGISDEENEEEGNVADLSASRLLMMSARDALTAFVLGGSSNLMLAGEAEDAARESCREEAKAFFWKRLNGTDSDEDSYGDDDEDEDEEVAPICSKSASLSALDEVLSKYPALQGSVASLCRSCRRDDHESKASCECADDRKGIYDAVMHSSCVPKKWMVVAFGALYAPIHIALDIPPPPSAAKDAPSKGQVAAYEDGLGEDPKPFEHLLVGGDKKNIISKASTSGPSVSWGTDGDIDDDDDQVEKEAAYFPDQPEGDDDAFRLICSVANALCLASTPTIPRPRGEDANKSSSPALTGIVTCEEGDVSAKRNDEVYRNVPVYAMPTANDLGDEIAIGLRVEAVEDIDVMSAGVVPSSPGSFEDESSVSKSKDGLLRNESVEDMCSTHFLEAFQLVTAPDAHELTGVTFTWKIVGADSFVSSIADEGVSYDNCRFRVSAALTSEMQDAICDRSMHNSMHNIDDDSLNSDESSLGGGNSGGGDVDDENDDEEDEQDLRKVSRRLRARLLSLCGSIAYLLGDAMGGYQCMKASIMLDGECVDSRIKISTMLMEMDELDKAEVHLNDAERKWPEEILVSLHKAELLVHQMDYSGAVDILRRASRTLDLEIGDDVGSGGNHKMVIMRHLAPTITALHGVAEFRINPENPDRALSVLQRGAKRYPDDASLQICLGEVLGQAGNPSGSFKAYACAAHIEPGHPMPYLNASKLYQQMNQLESAKEHMAKALHVDSSLAITLVDIAQYKIHESRRGGAVLETVQDSLSKISLAAEETSALGGVSHAEYLIQSARAMDILEYALDQARHVSEIIDVFTAKKIAEFYLSLQENGLAPCIL